MAVFNVPTTIATNVTGTNTDDQIFSIVDPFIASTGGAQNLFGGLGNDTYILGNTNPGAVTDIVFEMFGEGIDTVVLFTNVNAGYTLVNNVENLIGRRFTPTGTAAWTGNTLTGNQLNNLVTVDDGNFGLAGASETLDGGIGNDTMAAGHGNDTYIVDSALDLITESNTAVLNGFLTTGFINGVVLAGFVDTVQTTVSYTLGANLENLTLLGTPPNLNFNGTGNVLPNLITGNAGHNVLDGLDGNDTLQGGGGNDTLRGGGGNDTLVGTAGNTTMDGGAGNDLYSVDSALDVLLADAGGVDTVEFTSGAAFNTFVLPLFIENVMNMNAAYAVAFTGNALDNALYGNAGNDTLTGNDGNDVLDGGLGGVDSLSGGKGNDVYASVDFIAPGNTSNDILAPENLNEGIDTVYANVNAGQTFTLGANFERLFLLGATAAGGTGNILDNAIGGNSGNNTLIGLAGNDNINGQAGNDMLAGGLGNDILDGDAGNDSISGAQGNDNLMGGAGNDTMEGGDGADIMDGGTGWDSMSGGNGNDIYFVDTLTGTNPQTRDIVFELPGLLAGVDTVNSSVSIDLLFANVENLNLTGTANINGYGNGLLNIINGNIGANILDAGRDVGALPLNDVLVGGLGNDTYIIYGPNDIITEVANVLIPGVPPTLAPGFLDTVIYRGSVNYTLMAANTEILILDVGLGNINAVANALDNTITGSGGNNSIDGGGGNDIINGGNGNDTLLGGAGNDVLDGQLGNDSMIGGGGDDSYNVESASDIVDELTGGTGNDLVISFLRDINIDPLFNANMRGLIENVTLGGGALSATGNALNNIIRGNASLNYLTGAAGNDTYFANLGDQIIEGSALTGGIDTVNMDVGTGSGTITVRNGTAPFFAPANELWNVENVILQGTGSYDVIVARDPANPLITLQINILTGNDGSNILDGAGGADVMTGGKGNDTYYVDNAGDKTIEIAGTGQGIDTVNSTVAWVLQAETEHLNLIGTGILPVAGTGNLLSNFIRGNGAVNALSGLAGNDTLDGGGGNDVLNGADGDDTYWVDTLFDVVADTTGTDTVISTIAGPAGYNLTAAVTVENLVLFNGWALPPAVMNGTGNALDNRITGNVSYNTLDGGAGNDTIDFSIVGTFSNNDSAIGGLGTDTLSNDTLLADITNFSGTAQLDEIETAILRAEGGNDGNINFGTGGWEDLRAVNFTGSAGRTLTVNGAMHTGNVNNAPAGVGVIPLVFGLTDYDGAGVTINADTTVATNDVLNLAIRDSGLNTALTTAGWERITINNQPSADGSFAVNTLDMTGVTTAGTGTVIEVTGSGGGMLSLNMDGGTALGSLGGGAAFDRDLQVSVFNFTDQLQLRQQTGTIGDFIQVNVRDSSFWLDLGQTGGTDRDFENMEIFALAPLAPATVNNSFVHLNEASTVMGGTLFVGGAANSVLTIDGIRAGTINASTFVGSSLFLTAESAAGATWTGPNANSATLIFDFVGGGGADTFNFDAAPGRIDGLDLVDGGGGSDTVNVDVTGMGVSGTANSGGLHFVNVETVNMTNDGVAVVDAAMMSGDVLMQAGSGTSLTIHGLAGDFNAGGATGAVTIYSSATGGQVFNAFGAGTYTLFGSPGTGTPGDSFSFDTTLDSTDYVQAYDFDTAISDTLSAQLVPGSTLSPTILGVESITLTGNAGLANTFAAVNVVGTHTWTLSGAQTLTLGNLNWSPTATGQMIVNGAGLSGAFTVNGSDGNDSITGGSAVNTVYGGEGNDTLTGGASGDSMIGGNGNDSLNGAGGADSLHGGDGNDTFNISANDSAVDTIDGGEGTSDALSYSSVATAVTVNLLAGTASTGTTGTDSIAGIEHLIGGSGADTFTGSNAYTLNQDSNDYSETYQGRGGNDSINGGGTQNGYTDLADFSNNASGVAVNLDTVVGNVSMNPVTVPAGSTTITVNFQTITAGTGTDIAGGTGIATDTLTNVDGAFGTGVTDILIGGSSSRSFSGGLFELWRGNGGSDIIAGNAGALSSTLSASGTGTVDLSDFDMADYSRDTSGVFVDLRLGFAIDCTGGTDLLFDITHVRGSAFDDILNGGNAGNDAFEALEGMGGDDHINGGSGFDVARYTRADVGVDANLLTGIAQDGQGGIDSLINVEGLEGGDFNDTLTGSGNLAMTERFVGRMGDDSINGGAGNDMADYVNDPTAVTVNLSAFTATDGWGDTDTLVGIEDVRGSQFADTIVGDGNANRLDGGRNTFATSAQQGNDTLTGNAGADTFVFNTTLDGTNNVDEITDFTTASDKIELDDAIFTAIAPGTLSASDFVLGNTAGDASDRIIYDQTTGDLFYDADGQFGIGQVLFANLSNLGTLAASDIVIV